MIGCLLSGQDVLGVQLAYDTVILFLIKPSNQELIGTELIEAQVSLEISV